MKFQGRKVTTIAVINVLLLNCHTLYNLFQSDYVVTAYAETSYTLFYLCGTNFKVSIQYKMIY